MRFCLLVSILFPLAAVDADWFVAPNGDDSWSGKLAAPNAKKTDGPYATLGRARDEIRKATAAGSRSGPATVQVRAGTYALGETLKFGPEDAGTANAPIVFRAYAKEKPVIVGGKAIADWSPWKGEIMQAAVGAQGFQDIAFHQLLCNGERMPLARYPNFDAKNPYFGGWAFAEGEDFPMYGNKPGEDNHSLTYKEKDAREWAKPEEVEVFIFPRFNWWNNVERIKSIDREKRLITLAKDLSFAARGGDRYFVQNALEELDAPGEWYLDRAAGTLYFWPPSPIARATVVAPTLRHIVEFVPGAAFVTLRGLTFECSEGDAIKLHGATNCLIAGNTIRHVGDYGGSGVVVDGGTDNGVIGNDISFTGSHAVTVSGGEQKTLTPARNFVDNNYLHHFGVIHKQGVGVALEGVGNRVTHNLIHDGPRFAIMHGGNNNVIEFNRIRHVSLETEDTGAIYSRGIDWLTPRGTSISYNFITDIWGYGHLGGEKWVTPYFACGIYLDDNSAGVDVIGNIVARCSRGGMHCHSGRDNRIENNVWVDNGQWQVDFHGWKPPGGMWDQHFPTMVKGYESIADQPAWKGMRNLTSHPRDALLPDGNVMSGNQFLRNILAYRTDARVLDTNNLSPGKNVFDFNLAWHYGAPVLTGIKKFGEPGGENLAPSAIEGTVGEMPRGWEWQNRPDGANVVITEADGTRGFRMDGALKETPKVWERVPIIRSKDFTLQPGHGYQLRAKMQATQAEASGGLMLQNTVSGHFWASGPNEFKVGTEEQDVVFSFKIPAPGEKDYYPELQKFSVRLEFKEPTGALFVRDLELREVAPMDEWAAWQSNGYDEHSLVADPKFTNAAKDDYRLAAGSPALKLGFKPIPIAKIGPYKNPLRATWPLIEAEGARERGIVKP